MSLGPYFLSFLFVLREHQFNIPWEGGGKGCKDYMRQSPFHLLTIILTLTVTSRPQTPYFSEYTASENYTRCPPKTLANYAPSSAVAAVGPEHDMPRGSRNFPHQDRKAL